MTTDIEKLIERLRATRVDVYAGPEAADALTRLVARTLESLFEGRLVGIREAIAIVGSIGFGCESCIAEALARLSALLRPRAAERRRSARATAPAGRRSGRTSRRVRRTFTGRTRASWRSMSVACARSLRSARHKTERWPRR